MAAPVQIVWSFDTTGSMSSCLEAVKSEIHRLSARLLEDIPGLEIGLIAHGDYCDRHSSYLIRTMPFSTDPGQIEEWVKSVGPTGGGDAPEAYEIALRAAATEFKWNSQPDARKVLAMIGDELPHEADFVENVDRVDWNVELENLADLGVRCFGVQCNGHSHASHFYQSLAERTDGLWLPMRDLNIMADVFVAVCLQVSGTSAFDKFKAQLSAGGPVASALVPLVLKLAKHKKTAMSKEDLAAMCGVVAKMSQEHGKPPREMFLPVGRVDIAISVVGRGICEVELTQQFINRNELAGKGSSFEYRFALPAAAAVFHFQADLSSGRHIVGVLQGREEARREYQLSLSRGQTAFLMEEKNADIFSMELGNLAKDERVEIRLRYLTEAEDAGANLLRLRLPQHVAPRSGGKAVAGIQACYPITVNLAVTDSTHILGLRSLSHPSRFALLQSSGVATLQGRLTLLPEQGTLNEDLLFEMDLVDTSSEVGLDIERCDDLGSTVVRVALRPVHPIASSMPRNACHIALVIDASASMQGVSSAAARATAVDVLVALRESSSQARLSCFLMRNKVSLLCECVEPDAAVSVMRSSSYSCGGGSGFDATLTTLMNLSAVPDIIVFISDGHGPEQLQELFARVKNDSSPRIFCVGVGPDPRVELLHGLAAVGRGTSVVLGGSMDTSHAARRIVEDVLAAPVEIEIIGSDGVNHCEQWPARCVVAYPGHLVVVYVRFERTTLLESTLEINGVSFPLHGKYPIISGQRLHRLGARSRILELEQLNISGANDSAIKSLALSQGLISSQTSFIAVEQNGVVLGTVESPHDVSNGVDMVDVSRRHAPPARRDSFSSHEEVMELMKISLMRAEALDCLVAQSCELSMALSFRKEAQHSNSFQTRARMAAARFNSLTESITSSLASAFKCMVAPVNLLHAPAVLGPEVRLPSPLGGSFYVGTFTHSAFGSEDHDIVLVIDSLILEPSTYSGRWTSVGQTEEVVIDVDVELGTISISSEACMGTTVLRGTMNSTLGTLCGECVQDGVCGGRFVLAPLSEPARVEFIDTDGDHIAFVRLLHGGAAEYCNRKLVKANVTELRINESSGECDDGLGTFIVPSADVTRVIPALRSCLAATKARVVLL